MGNITADVAKVIVSIFITNIVISFTGGIFLTVALGLIITTALFKMDEEYSLSTRLINNIKEGMDKQQKIMEWNMLYSSSYTSSSPNRDY